MNEPNQADTLEETRWNAIVRRESLTTDSFIYAVKTTGIFCRVGCPSRRPKRENVRLFEDVPQALAAGFRPCKRCHPIAKSESSGDRVAEAIVTSCRVMEQSEAPVGLDQLAAIAEFSPPHFQRVFKKHVGVSPKAYEAMSRATRVRQSLKAGRDLATAIYESGYATGSRFYAQSNEILGMTPKEFQQGGTNAVIEATVLPTPLGPMLIAATEKGVCHIEFGSDEAELENRLREDFDRATIQLSPKFERFIATVLEQIEEPETSMDLPLDIRGTAFQRRVWEQLLKIPVGETVTYSQLAKQIGNPNATRAVAGACAANRIALAIPCHRVIRSDGGLGGYRWGMERKQSLLEREAARKRK